MEIKDRSRYCATCGKPRGPLEDRRESWGLRCPTAKVPLPSDSTQKPWQCLNDLIISAAVYRNGGTSDDCHPCDDCLRIGLRAIKTEIDRLLEVIESDADKDREIAELQARLYHSQWEVWAARVDRDAAQSRERRAKQESAQRM